jgi:hypothetical protein
VPRVRNTATTVRALNHAPTEATALHARRKRPSRKARIPVRVRLHPDATAMTVARVQQLLCTHKDMMTTTVNRHVILKKIFSRVPMPTWARKAA